MPRSFGWTWTWNVSANRNVFEVDLFDVAWDGQQHREVVYGEETTLPRSRELTQRPETTQNGRKEVKQNDKFKASKTSHLWLRFGWDGGDPHSGSAAEAQPAIGWCSQVLWRVRELSHVGCFIFDKNIQKQKISKKMYQTSYICHLTM